MAVVEEVPAVAEEVVVEEPELEVLAYSWGMFVAAVAVVVPAAAEEEAEEKQVLVALAEAAGHHILPAAVVEFLHAVDHVVEEVLAAGVVADAAAGAVGLRHKGSGFHHGPFVGRHGLSK